METIFIDPNSSFKEIVENIEVIKSLVGDILTSFSSFEMKKQIAFKKYLRDQIYSLNFELWKRERILEAIYDDFPIYKLKNIKWKGETKWK